MENKVYCDNCRRPAAANYQRLWVKYDIERGERGEIGLYKFDKESMDRLNDLSCDTFGEFDDITLCSICAARFEKEGLFYI